jgi:hypothetical protein
MAESAASPTEHGRIFYGSPEKRIIRKAEGSENVKFDKALDIPL